MNKLYKLFFLNLFVIAGCKSGVIENNIVKQSIDNFNMNIFSREGIKMLSIKSPYSDFIKQKNIFNLKETTIYLFNDKKKEYTINSDEAKLSNNNKLVELNGNVIVKTHLQEGDKLYTDNFVWNIDNSEYLLNGNVTFENSNISLSSNKAILDKTNNIIEFFNPVKYIIKDSNSKSSYEINSENAYYNIKSKSVSFRSRDERVRSKITF